ncbi:MAG: cytochrome c oxidase assembly protein [Gammaproteobacteria bacterium]|nr:MAG: cytochrome c oxidase assembly protein [Gammaproteobacteria bacterium]
MRKPAADSTAISLQQRNGKTAWQLALIVVGMFGFGFALVPLYDLLCEVTGLGGRTGGAYAYDPATVQPDKSRLIQVNFTTNTNAGMPWEFWAEKGGVRVHPGELRQMNFFVRNTTDRRMIGQAVPSVVPPSAAQYFRKIECFCFEQQVLEPGELLEMPMRFIIAKELPKNVQTLSLSYELFDVTNFAASVLVAGSEGHGVAGYE